VFSQVMARFQTWGRRPPRSTKAPTRSSASWWAASSSPGSSQHC